MKCHIKKSCGHFSADDVEEAERCYAPLPQLLPQPPEVDTRCTVAFLLNLKMHEELEYIINSSLPETSRDALSNGARYDAGFTVDQHSARCGQLGTKHYLRERGAHVPVNPAFESRKKLHVLSLKLTHMCRIASPRQV